MDIKNILLHVGADDALESRLEVAVRLAGVKDAHLIGLFVAERLEVPTYAAGYYGATYFPPELVEYRREKVAEQTARTKQIFESRALRENISLEWRVANGDVRDALSLHARYADLAVISQAMLEEGGPRIEDQILNELVLTSGRPILLVPDRESFTTIGTRILVCWNESAQAARAIQDALPFLEMAEQVFVLTVDGEGDKTLGTSVEGLDICTHLARHGVKAQAEQGEAQSRSVGEVINDACRALGADMIVTGAWGHSRVRELVFGGVTRHLMHAAEVPVLMSH